MLCETYEYSFIVPVYNAEKCIAENIESILRQGERCELILVDDGSTDSSGVICDKYAESHNRVNVYHRANGGPAAARNFGLEKAKGTYCVFIDSDDYISDTLIGHLADEHIDRRADVIFYNMIKVFPNGTQRQMAEGLKRKEIHNKTKEDVLKAISKCSKFPASTGGKMIKTEFLKNNTIRFAEGLIGEDIDWTLQLLDHMTSADVYENGSYYYRISQNSRHAYGKEKSLDDQLKIIETWLKKSIHNKNQKYIVSFLAYQYAVSLPFYGALSKETRKKYTIRMKKLRFLLAKGKTNKIRLIRLAVFLLGTDKAARLLYQYVVKRDE